MACYRLQPAYLAEANRVTRHHPTLPVQGVP
jgi:hypothetical protein